MASGRSGGGGAGLARLLAIIAAIALIVGGLLIRTALDDDDDNGGGGGGDDPATSTSLEPAEATEVVCITELEAVCDKIDGEDLGVTVKVEPAGTTLDRLGETEDGPAPLWITIDPFPAMVDELREGNRLEALGYTSQAAGATQLAIATPNDGRWSLLNDQCGAPVWFCIGDWAGSRWDDHGGDVEWGTVRPAIGDAETSALALATLASAVAGYSESGAIDSSLWTHVDFITWFDELTGAVTPDRLTAGTPLATMVVLPSRIDVAATSSAEFALLPGAQSNGHSIHYPEPSMWATAVLAAPASKSAPDGLLDELASALDNSGWLGVSEATTPLPDASIMLALRELWRNP